MGMIMINDRITGPERGREGDGHGAATMSTVRVLGLIERLRRHGYGISLVSVGNGGRVVS